MLVDHLQGIAVIWINGPEAFNSFDERTVSALPDRLEQAATELDVYGVVLTVSGRVFRSGGQR